MQIKHTGGIGAGIVDGMSPEQIREYARTGQLPDRVPSLPASNGADVVVPKPTNGVSH